MIKKKAIKKYNYKGNIAIILACGQSKRLKSKSPKQYIEFFEDIILNHTIKIFLKNNEIDHILLVLNKKHKKFFNKIIQDKKISYTYGGDSRQKSVFYGLKYIKRFKPINVLIHDANRPFTNTKLISEILKKLRKFKAVIPRIKIQDTIKKVENNKITHLNRDKIFALQTPQGFKFKELLKKHINANGENFTDDSSLFDDTGKIITYIYGNNENIKITNKSDLKLAEKLYYSKNKSNFIGLGIDFHRFNNKKGKLILCGVKIPFHKTLIAHSDGDLGYHAISDGILGAISEGDIGIHFPDTSKKNKNLNSAKILKYTYELMKKKINRDIKNIDLTFIGEEPKFSKYQKKMKVNISKLLNLDLNQINIKATTTEKMGPLGNKEGLGAFALVNII
jgi:2-C-methyl-D-erythritol 4-phosphate cytidylyltransferase/2-C-methyl-D-erythritol 2,4-cyclodiphosphate synthase